MDDHEWLGRRFEEHRPRLRAVAYRMLGSTAEAEDAVQEAWLRLDRAGAEGVDNLGGWLTTVVARVCLDALRARRRREQLVEQLPDPVVTAEPEQEAELADSVGLALLVVLETLPPAERLAFVLHDTFGVPFDEIAPIVERSPQAARQLASRARRRVHGAAPPADVDPARQREVVAAFLAATRAGDFEGLLAVLDPDVVLRVDQGPGRLQRIHGAESVARRALGFRSVAAGTRVATVNGTAGLVALQEGRPLAVMGCTVAGGRIVEMDILADRRRLRDLDLSALSA